MSHTSHRVCVALAAAAIMVSGRVVTTFAADIGTADVVCGPRCVVHVLNYYGKKADLIEVVRRIQWPNIEQGASLEAISRELEAHGIHTRGLRLGQSASLAWKYPVIVHFKSPVPEQPGHFAVWYGITQNGDNIVWSGLSGSRRLGTTDFSTGRSGVVLLTSPSPIQDGDSAVLSRPGDATLHHFWYLTIKVAVAVATMGSLILMLLGYVLGISSRTHTSFHPTKEFP